MKKLIAILVVFAMVSTVAFAETTISAGVRVDWIIADKAEGSDDITTHGMIDSMNVQFSAVNDEGTFGGLGKFVVGNVGSIETENTAGTITTITGYPGHELSVGWVRWDRAFAWWQPIPQVKFWLGKDGAGMFNTAGLTRWGHHRGELAVAKEDWDAGNYMLGNWDAFGVALIITPMDGLEINLALPIPGVQGFTIIDNTADPTLNSDNTALEYGDWFKGLQAQVGYNLDGIGKFFLTYQGETAGDAIGLTYQSASFVEGLQFEVGFAYKGLAVDTEDHLRIGLGVHYSMGDFGVRTRFFLDPTHDKTAAADGYFRFKADIMPYYALSFGTVYCNIRFMKANKDDIGWHVNPYVKLNVGIGDLALGLMINDEDGNGKFAVSVPLTLAVNF